MRDENPPKPTEKLVDFHGDFLEYCAQRYDGCNLIYPTGFQTAIMGVCDDPTLVMSTSEAIRIIQKDCGLNYEDAIDHYYYNVKGAFYGGDQNPIWIDTVEDYATGEYLLMDQHENRQIVVVNNCELEINHRRHEVRFLTLGHDWDVAAKAAIYLRQEGFLGDDDSQAWSIHPPEDLFPF